MKLQERRSVSNLIVVVRLVFIAVTWSCSGVIAGSKISNNNQFVVASRNKRDIISMNQSRHTSSDIGAVFFDGNGESLGNRTVDEIAGVDNLTRFEWNFYVFNGIVGSVLSFTVLLIGLAHADTYDKPRQIIVMNMTFADLATCLVYMLTRPFLNRFEGFMCYPYYVIIFTSQLCSCLNLLWLNVDKLIYIKFPLHYYQLVTRKRILLLTVLSWLVLVVLALAVYSVMDVVQACNVVRISPLIYLPICVLYVLLITNSFGISAVIYCIAQNSRKIADEAKSRLFKRLFFVFSSTMWTFATCLPYRLLYLTNVLCTACRSDLLTSTTNTFFSILVLGIVMNPVVTMITQRLYRQAVIVYSRMVLAAVFRRLPCCANVCVELQNYKRRSDLNRSQRRRSRPAFQHRSRAQARERQHISPKAPNKEEKTVAFANSKNLTIFNTIDSRKDLFEMARLTPPGGDGTRVESMERLDAIDAGLQRQALLPIRKALSCMNVAASLATTAVTTVDDGGGDSSTQSSPFSQFILIRR